MLTDLKNNTVRASHQNESQIVTSPVQCRLSCYNFNIKIQIFGWWLIFSSEPFHHAATEHFLLSSFL